MGQVQAALKHLDEAVSKLESALGRVQAKLPLADNAAVLEQKVGELTKQNTDLKMSAGQVAERLDAAIGRLSAAMKE